VRPNRAANRAADRGADRGLEPRVHSSCAGRRTRERKRPVCGREHRPEQTPTQQPASCCRWPAAGRLVFVGGIGRCAGDGGSRGSGVAVAVAAASSARGGRRLRCAACTLGSGSPGPGSGRFGGPARPGGGGRSGQLRRPGGRSRRSRGRPRAPALYLPAAAAGRPPWRCGSGGRAAGHAHPRGQSLPAVAVSAPGGSRRRCLRRSAVAAGRGRRPPAPATRDRWWHGRGVRAPADGSRCTTCPDAALADAPLDRGGACRRAGVSDARASRAGMGQPIGGSESICADVGVDLRGRQRRVPQ
jgi:hypothetical protein